MSHRGEVGLVMVLVAITSLWDTLGSFDEMFCINSLNSRSERMQASELRLWVAFHPPELVEIKYLDGVTCTCWD